MSEEFQDVDEGVASSGLSHPLPSSQQMASHLGLDTHQMQIMKASFFGSNVLDQRTHSKPLTQPHPQLQVSAGFGAHSRITSQLPAQSHSLSFSSSSYQQPPLSDSFRRRDHQRSTISMSPQPSLRPQPLSMQTHTRPTLVLPKRNLNRLVPMSQSISNTKTGLVADHGLVFGRSFRVGWGPNWTLAHSGIRISQVLPSGTTVTQPIFNLSTTTSFGAEDSQGVKFRVLIEKVDASPWMKPGLVPPTGDVKVKEVSQIFAWHVQQC